MKTAAAYIRVSTDEQVEYSPESQLKNIKSYAQTHSFILPDKFIFIDEGLSGKNTKKRSEFNRMIGISKTLPKPFDAILLWKFSRFARNREDSVVYKSMLRKQLGIEVISISESLGDDKISVLIEALIEAMDEYYSINLAEEVKRGMTERASRGGAVSAPAFGYLMKDKMYVPDEMSAAAVKMLFKEYAAGKSCRELAEKLNILGYKTKRGNPWEARTVSYLLQNPVYNGKIRWNTDGRIDCSYSDNNAIFVAGEHTALVDDELFCTVQNRIKRLKKSCVRHYKTGAPCKYMLKGLVRCSSCGASMTMLSGSKSLQCHRYSQGKCKISHSISLDILNDLIIRCIETALRNTEIPLYSNNSHTPFHINNAGVLIKQEESKLLRIRDALECGVYTPEEYSRRKNIILSGIEKLKEKTSCETKNTQKYPDKINVAAYLKDPKIPEENKNLLLRSFIESIVFDRKNSSCDIYFYD